MSNICILTKVSEIGECMSQARMLLGYLRQLALTLSLIYYVCMLEQMLTGVSIHILMNFYISINYTKRHSYSYSFVLHMGLNHS
jgi:hypothetical protein